MLIGIPKMHKKSLAKAQLLWLTQIFRMANPDIRHAGDSFIYLLVLLHGEEFDQLSL